MSLTQSQVATVVKFTKEVFDPRIKILVNHFQKQELRGFEAVIPEIKDKWRYYGREAYKQLCSLSDKGTVVKPDFGAVFSEIMKIMKENSEYLSKF